MPRQSTDPTPDPMPDDGRAGRVVCPFCESTDNEFFSLFGQSLIGSQYYCRNCRTVFEAVRWVDGGQTETKVENDDG